MLAEVSKELRMKIIDENFEQLLATKQYKLAAEVLNKRGRSFFSWEFHYETDKYFPRISKHMRYDQQEIIDANLDVFRKHGLEVFELALATRKTIIAQEVARRLFLHCENPRVYTDLIEIAMRVGTKTFLKQLMTKAKTQLMPDEFSQLKK